MSKRKSKRPRYVDISRTDTTGAEIVERIWLKKGQTANEARRLHLLQLKKEAILLSIDQGSTKEAAAEAAGIHRQTLWRWEQDDPEFANSILKLQEKCVSMVMSAHYAHALKPEGVADRIFFLKNRAGMSDRKEISGPGGGPIQTEANVAVGKLTRQNLDKLVDNMTEEQAAKMYREALAEEGEDPAK